MVVLEQRQVAFMKKDVAASTTATGRKLSFTRKGLLKKFTEIPFVDTEKYGKVRSRAKYIYGDTDSVFFTFNLEH